MSQNRQYVILYKEIEVKESTAVSEFSLVEADKIAVWRTRSDNVARALRRVAKFSDLN